MRTNSHQQQQQRYEISQQEEDFIHSCISEDQGLMETRELRTHRNFKLFNTNAIRNVAPNLYAFQRFMNLNNL